MGKGIIGTGIADTVEVIFEFAVLLIQVVAARLLFSKSGRERDLFIQQILINFLEAKVRFLKIILLVIFIFVVGLDSLPFLGFSIFVDCAIANLDFTPIFN